jgi:hypothetical protein
MDWIKVQAEMLKYIANQDRPVTKIKSVLVGTYVVYTVNGNTAYAIPDNELYINPDKIASTSGRLSGFG